jgi:ketosteroid isomerase-like protein
LRTRGLLAFALIVGTACGASAPAATKKKDVGPAVDERTAEKDVKGTVEEIYQAISRAKPDNLFSVVDEKLIVFGPRKGDALGTRTDALVALGKVVDSKSKEHTQVRSGELAVVASPGGRSAWAFDVVNVDGTPLAVIAIMSSEDDFFRLTAAAMAHTPSMREIRSELKKDAIVPPGVGRATASNIASGAKGAVERFQKGLLDQQAWGDDLGSRTEAIYIGPAIGEVTRGKKEIKKLWKKRIEAETRAATSGEVTAEITADGQLAWVTSPITRVEKDEDPLPLRAFAVFEKDGDGWKMIALHESLAVDEPGAGAAFAKILPPSPKPPEPPAEVEDSKKPDKKAETTKKKKKKKKKKKLSDDDE